MSEEYSTRYNTRVYFAVTYLMAIYFERDSSRLYYMEAAKQNAIEAGVTRKTIESLVNVPKRKSLVKIERN